MTRMKYRLLVAAVMGGLSAQAQVTPACQMELLGRGVVAVPTQSGSGRFVSWRMLGTDPLNTSFDVLRNGKTIASNVRNRTCYVDASGTATSSYQVVTRVGGEVTETSDAATPWADIYTTLRLDRPDGGTTSSSAYTYTPNDMSVGDVDGDGQYELFVKWDPSNSSDNAGGSFTGNTLIDCYRLDGTKLWRVDLGQNIRSGAHYVQFLVYDFDGDGRAEMMVKTGPGSKDGNGSYVTAAATDNNIKKTDNTADYHASNGMILSGPEFLTVFNGLTGAAVHTVWYNPNRAGGYGVAADYPSDSKFWGDNSGNRGDRFLAAVAHLEKGQRAASAVFVRGYYTRAYLWAVDFDGSQIKTRWLHHSDSKTTYSVTSANGSTQKYSGLKPTSGGGSGTMYSNGNHNLSVADVDGDGCDEIVWGSAACDHDGRLLYGVGFGHGDAIHLTDLMPDRPGLEVFDVHEDKSQTYCWDIHDARTGEVLLKGGPKGVDNGRGIAAQVDAAYRGFYFNSSAVTQTLGTIDGDTISQYGPTIQNFRIYWDGDLQDEYLGDISRHNQPFLEKWNGNGCSRMYPKRNTNLYSIGNSTTCNDTKGTPCLQADILGDWREEMIFFDGSDPSVINIFTTNIPTTYRVPTLMHDHVYRMGIAWQNVAYNQPPHLGYYLPDADYSYQEEPVVEPVEEQKYDTLFVQDYEKAVDASSWTFTKTVSRGELTLQTGDAAQGNYVQFYLPSSVNSTPVYTLLSSGENDSYVVQFDALFSAGNKDGGEFVVATQSGNLEVPQKDVWFNYGAYNGGAHMLFHLAIPANSSSVVINDNDANTAVLANGQWCSYELKVDGEKRTVDYLITSKATGGKLAEGTFALPEATTSTRLQGLYFLNGRYYGKGCFDNIRVLIERLPFLPGDVNGDGIVSVTDVTMVINHILGKAQEGFNAVAAEVTGDGKIDVSDVTAIINIILHK